MEKNDRVIKPIDMDDDFYDDYDDNSAVYEDYRNVIDNIGKENFRSVFIINRAHFLSNDNIKINIAFCRTIYNKFFELTEFQPTPAPDFLLSDDRIFFIELLEFYYYDYIDFFTNLFVEMDLTLDEIIKPKFVEEIFLKKIDKALQSTDKVVKVYVSNWILSQFLITYNKDKFVKWMGHSINVDKSLIIMELMNLMEV